MASRVLLEKARTLSESEVLRVFNEICLYNGVSFDKDLHLQFELTDLQIVAAAAAMASVVEMGAALDNERFDYRPISA